MPSLKEPKNQEARLLLVSNRLPITIKRSEDGKYDFSMSSGGLVSGLSGLSKSTTFQWYGWPGLEVPEEEIPVVKQRLKDEYGAVPVFIDDELADRHYNGFSSEWTSGARGMLACTDVDVPWQTLSFGHCFTTTLVRSLSMSRPGKHTRRRIAFLPGPSRKKCRTAI